MEKISEIKKKLQDCLTGKRYEHTLGVEYTCCSLGMRYGIDLEKARMAGLLHDCAKCFSGEELLQTCAQYQLPVSREERAFPELLHAKVGSYLAKEEYGVDDPEILSAILWHTTGHPDMTILEKILYIADYIEPNRNQAPHLDKLRRLAFQDLDACLLGILTDTLSYLKEKGGVIDPATQATYEYYNGNFNQKQKKHIWQTGDVSHTKIRK